MKTNFAFSAATVTVAALLFTGQGVAAVPADRVNAAIPLPPAAPRYLPFADEVAGRHLLFAARDAYFNGPSVTLTAQWTLLTASGTGMPVAVQSGTESISAQPAARKITLTMETRTRDGDRTIRRAIANGETLLTTRFEEKPNGKTPPAREYSRLPLDEGALLSRALNQAQVFPGTQAGALLLMPDFVIPGDAVLWRTTPTVIDGTSADTVCRIEEKVSENKRERERIRRYAFARATHVLLRDEEWTITRDPQRARPATKNRPADNGTRILYRREDYSNTRILSGPLPASLFVQALPTAYVEKQVETGDASTERLPLPPDSYDPKALALLQRWRVAQERFLTLSAEIEVTFRGEQRSADARPLPQAWQDTAIRYAVTLRRPGRARVVMNTLRGGFPGEPRSLIAVSDGTSVRAVDEGGQSRTVPLNAPGNLWNDFRQVGLMDRFGALTYLYSAPPPPDAFDKVTYEGPAVLEGTEPVQVILLSREISGTARRQRDAETTSLMRVFLGPDGMPRQIESRNVTNVSGLFTRDQPPIYTIVRRFHRMSIDSEPPSTAFVLPAAKG